MNQGFRYYFSRISLLLGIFTSFMAPLRALDPLTSTVAYVGLAAAKHCVMGAVMGYGLGKAKALGDNVYNVYKAGQLTFTSEDLRKERFMSIYLDKNQDTLIFEQGLSLYIPSPLRGKYVQVDLAMLELTQRLVTLSDSVQTSNSVLLRNRVIQVLENTKKNMCLKIMAEAGNAVAMSAERGLYFQRIIEIIDACSTMLRQSCSIESKRERDAKIAHALCVKVRSDVPTTPSAKSSKPIASAFVTKNYYQKVEHFKAEDAQARAASANATTLASFAFILLAYPALAYVAKAAIPGICKSFTVFEYAAQSCTQSLLQGIGNKLGLVAAQASGTSGIGAHARNLLMASSSAAGAIAWLGHRCNKIASNKNINSSANLISSSILSPVGSLLSSSWTKVFVDVGARSGSWPLYIGSWATYFAHFMQ